MANGALTKDTVFDSLVNNEKGTSSVGFIPEVVAADTTKALASFGTWTVAAP